MKKLMIAAAIVCAAAMSQAATYNWVASSTGVLVDTTSPIYGGEDCVIAGLPVYIFDANVVDRALFTDGISSDALGGLLDRALLTSDGQLYAVGEAYGAFTTTGKGDFDGVTNPGAVGLSAVGGVGSAYAVILDADAANATTFFVTDPITDIDCGGLVASMGSQAEITFGDIDATGDWSKVAAAPEPTSGLLLLLGVAGLALRRRRA